jgi:Cu/Ag efflux protein CusF
LQKSNDVCGAQMAHAGDDDAHGTGTVNSVDPAQHKVNLSHNPTLKSAGRR